MMMMMMMKMTRIFLSFISMSFRREETSKGFAEADRSEKLTPGAKCQNRGEEKGEGERGRGGGGENCGMNTKMRSDQKGENYLFR